MLTYIPLEYILAISAITWHYALFCGFISDDHAAIAQRIDIIPDGEKNPVKEKYWIKVLNDGVIMYYLNKIMRRIFSTAPIGWHLFSFSMHILNTYLFYLVACQLVGVKMAGFAALLWTVNPMLNQVVAWCSG